MFRLFPVVLILQIYCLYHAYKNNADQKWYWFILIFPLIGCILYLYHHFYSRENIEKVSETIKVAADSNYKIRRLENDVSHNDSFENKERLADEYLVNKRYEDAINLYKQCLSGINENDPSILRKLIGVQHELQNHEEIIKSGELLSADREFNDSIENAFYAWALYHKGNTEKAQEVFESMDVSYMNYFQRIEYAKFLNIVDKKQEAIEKLNELAAEFNRLNSREKRMHKGLGGALKKLRIELES